MVDGQKMSGPIGQPTLDYPKCNFFFLVLCHHQQYRSNTHVIVDEVSTQYCRQGLDARNIMEDVET